MGKKQKGKGKKDQDKKKKKSGKSIALIALVPLLIILLIASFIFAIFDGILGIIMDLVNEILDFFQDPIGWFAEKWRDIKNWAGSWLVGDYNPPEPEEAYMKVLIDDDTVDTVRDNMAEVAIDPNEAGMTENVLKKMILSYYMTLATVDTIIYTPINEYEVNGEDIIVDEQVVSPISGGATEASSGTFVYFWGDGDKFGEEDKLYMATKGTIVVLNDEEEQMQYYDFATLEQILAEFRDSVNNEDRQGYIESFKDTFKHIYTVSEGGMGSVAAITYSLSDMSYNDLDCFNIKVLDYRGDVANYVMPIELMVDFLNITASSDFIDAVSDLVQGSEIKIRINQSSSITKTTYDKSITLNGVQDETLHNTSDESVEDISALNSYLLRGGSYTESAQYTETHERTDYILTLKSVKCWYCSAEFTTEEQFDTRYLNQDGNEQLEECAVDISDEFEVNTQSQFTIGELANYRNNTFIFTEKKKSENLFGIANAKLTNENTILEQIMKYSGDYIIIPKYNSITTNATKTVKTTTRNWVQTTQTFEDNTQPFIDLLGKEYDDLYKSKTKPGDLLCNADEMFFQFLEQSPNTAKYVNVMKYILYKYSGIDYGVTDFNDLDIFNLRDFHSAGSSSSGILKQYIRYWENAGGAPTSDDGKNYIIEDDGAGHPTVGFGVDIENSGYKHLFEEAGYPTTIGGEVPVEFVDAIEDMIRNEKQGEIEALISGLELTGYQMNALISRAYNCGSAGAVSTLRGSPSMDFKDSYNEYWNEETDDLFEEQNKNADFNHKLYTQYMSKPVTSNGKYMAGLERRRKSEWVLFQTGYYDVLLEWYTEGGTIIECAKMIHEYMEANNYTYCVYYCNSYEECGKYGKSCGLDKTFEKSKNGHHNTCCATYVSWVLQEAGYITEDEHTNGANTIDNLLRGKGWQQISYSQLEPGDILYYGYGHVEIYAGDNTVYNAGSGSAIRGASPHSKNVSSMTRAWRAPN